MEPAVVYAHLVENVLGEAYCRGFELDDADGAEGVVVDDGITPFLEVGHFYRSLHGYLLLGETLFHERVEKILAHPLFRRKAHEFSAPYAEDIVLIVLFADRGGVHGEWFYFNIDFINVANKNFGELRKQRHDGYLHSP